MLALRSSTYDEDDRDITVTIKREAEHPHRQPDRRYRGLGQGDRRVPGLHPIRDAQSPLAAGTSIPFMPQEVLTLGGRYVLGTEIASGGMATVWLARDDVLARAVAVKVLHPHLADDEDFLARFRREALAAARLAHPNIVAIYDTGSEEPAGGEERHYIVMEYCGGGTLAPLVEPRGTASSPTGRYGSARRSATRSATRTGTGSSTAT